MAIAWDRHHDAANDAGPDDGTLLKRAGEGDELAFHELYRRYYTKVFSLCRRRVGDSLAAEELAQDVFVKAFVNLDSLRRSMSLLPWLLKVARNTCIDYQRIVRPREVTLDHVPADASRTTDPTGDEASVRVSARRIWEQVFPVLGELEKKDRQLLWQRDVEGRSYGDLVAIEGDSKHSLRNRIFRSRMLIRERLDSLREDVRNLMLIPGAIGRYLARRARIVYERAYRFGEAGASLVWFSTYLTMLIVSLSGDVAPFDQRNVISPVRSNPARSVRIDPRETFAAMMAPADEKTGELQASVLPLQAKVTTHQNEGAAVPDSTGVIIGLYWPDGHPVFTYQWQRRCLNGQSQILPKTGAVERYC